jgi:hypothetical protein
MTVFSILGLPKDFVVGRNFADPDPSFQNGRLRIRILTKLIKSQLWIIFMVECLTIFIFIPNLSPKIIQVLPQY